MMDDGWLLPSLGLLYSLIRYRLRAPLQQNLVAQRGFCCPFGLAFFWTARYLQVNLSPVRRRPVRKRLMPPGATRARGE